MSFEEGWYARTYVRPKILWDEPVSAAAPSPRLEA
jgi:hypothetical protein